ncbi:UNVERIFIED_CONTAM: hypothetical protein PYX00_011374 [Menopon gallinae]|uniref:Uncharacterized protein n=1 Tax=Menopon gallinae TaxID=328185 RepID=A0AAW2H7G9_9NEOP
MIPALGAGGPGFESPNSPAQMYQYVLCSSSSEEEAGEVVPDTKHHAGAISTQCLFTRSLYYNSRYVGKNRRLTGLRVSFSGHKPEHIKNKLKKTPPFSYVVAFVSHASEPVYKQSFCGEVVPVPHSFILVCTSRTLGILEYVEHGRPFRDTYSEALRAVSQYGTGTESVPWLEIEEVPERMVLIQDTTLNNLGRFRTPFTVVKSGGTLKVLFRHSTLENLCLDDAVRMYGEYCVAQASPSKEYRVFRSNSTILVVFSTSLFMRYGKEHRLHKSVDCPKTCDVLVEEDLVNIIDGYDEGLAQELDLLNGMAPSEGDYVLFERNVYRVDGREPCEQSHIDYKSICGTPY